MDRQAGKALTSKAALGTLILSDHARPLVTSDLLWVSQPTVIHVSVSVSADR